MGVIDRIVELLAAEDELTELCHTAFAAYDEDESGSMDAKELHAVSFRGWAFVIDCTARVLSCVTQGSPVL